MTICFRHSHSDDENVLELVKRWRDNGLDDFLVVNIGYAAIDKYFIVWKLMMSVLPASVDDVQILRWWITCKHCAVITFGDFHCIPYGL